MGPFALPDPAAQHRALGIHHQDWGSQSLRPKWHWDTKHSGEQMIGNWSGTREIAVLWENKNTFSVFNPKLCILGTMENFQQNKRSLDIRIFNLLEKLHFSSAFP